jgi:retron-type reverse transcriptase
MSGQDGKPFDIPETLVWQAWKRVAVNGGAPGADGVTIEDFKADLGNNLYKIWNRMSSGTYFPPLVRAVEIPKSSGGTRILGVPTVGDRVAQTVAAMALEPRAEAVFHDDSYGCRRERGALDAVGMCRERCWKKDWVIDPGICQRSLRNPVGRSWVLLAGGHQFSMLMAGSLPRACWVR